MKPTKSAWLIWGMISALGLVLVVSGYWVHSTMYQVMASTCMFVPIFVGIAFSSNGKRKP